jgi:hypothetical protein
MSNIIIKPSWELYYKGKYQVLYDCSKELPGLSIAIWIGFFNIDDPVFIDEMEISSINFIRDKKIVAMVSDHSETTTAAPKTIDWIEELWYGNAYKYGLRFEAIIPPLSTIGKLSVNRIKIQGKTKGVEIVSCADFESAYKQCVNYLKNYKI